MSTYPTMAVDVAAELVRAFIETVPGRSPIIKPDPARADRLDTMRALGFTTRRGRVTDAGWNAFATMDAHATGRAFVDVGMTGLFHEMGVKEWERIITRARLVHGPARHAVSSATRVVASLSLAQRHTIVHAFMWASPDLPIALATPRSRYNPPRGRMDRLAAVGVVDPHTAHVTETGVETFLRIDPDKFGRDLLTSRRQTGHGTMGPDEWARHTALSQRLHSCRLPIMA